MHAKCAIKDIMLFSLKGQLYAKETKHEAIKLNKLSSNIREESKQGWIQYDTPRMLIIALCHDYYTQRLKCLFICVTKDEFSF